MSRRLTEVRFILLESLQVYLARSLSRRSPHRPGITVLVISFTPLDVFFVSN